MASGTLFLRRESMARGHDHFLDYCCPRCQGSLESQEEGYSCEHCAQIYPILMGIPDFRVCADPVPHGEEGHKAQKLVERYPHTDFKGLLEYYWSLEPNKLPDLVQRYIRHALTGADRGRQSLEAIAAGLPHVTSGPDRCFLELGCGTGGFLVAASERF